MRFPRIQVTAGGLLVGALIAAGALWGVQFAANPRGAASHAFFERGRDSFGDFRMPRVCAEWGYANDRQPRCDSCYPALGSALVKPFPFEAGGWFTALGALLWAAAFLALADGGMGWGALVAGLLSAPMVFALERGNPVVHAAAAALLFVAWHDAEVRWKRAAAMLALAAAAALKVAPAALGVLYFARGRRRARDGEPFARGVWLEMAACAGLCAALFFVPFAWFGGCDGFMQWLSNAGENARHYAHSGAWGLVAIGRTVRSVLLHMDVTHAWPGIGAERLVNAALGLGCLAAAVAGPWRRTAWRAVPAGEAGGAGDVLMLVTAGMLLVPGNMHFYSGIYLLPVLAMRLREGMAWGEAACWFALLCPLQLPMGAGSLNRPLANLAFMGLLALAGVRRWKGARHDS